VKEGPDAKEKVYISRYGDAKKAHENNTANKIYSPQYQNFLQALASICHTSNHPGFTGYLHPDEVS